MTLWAFIYSSLHLAVKVSHWFANKSLYERTVWDTLETLHSIAYMQTLG